MGRKAVHPSALTFGNHAGYTAVVSAGGTYRLAWQGGAYEPSVTDLAALKRT